MSKKIRCWETIKASQHRGPSGETRTRGILVPNQAPYQLGHTRKYAIVVLQKAAPYCRLASALSICKQCYALQQLLSNWATPGNMQLWFYDNGTTTGYRECIIHHFPGKCNQNLLKIGQQRLSFSDMIRYNDKKEEGYYETFH